MSENLPEKKHPPSEHDLFDQWKESIQHFFAEPPIRDLMESIDDFFHAPFLNGFPVDVQDREEKYIITAKLPGINKDQIKIDIFQRSVAITVQQRELMTKKDQTDTTIAKKQSYQKASRTIPLQVPIDENRVKANHVNGLLTLELPKLKGKRIDIY